MKTNSDNDILSGHCRKHTRGLGTFHVSILLVFFFSSRAGWFLSRQKWDANQKKRKKKKELLDLHGRILGWVKEAGDPHRFWPKQNSEKKLLIFLFLPTAHTDDDSYETCTKCQLPSYSESYEYPTCLNYVSIENRKQNKRINKNGPASPQTFDRRGRRTCLGPVGWGTTRPPAPSSVFVPRTDRRWVTRPACVHAA